MSFEESYRQQMRDSTPACRWCGELVFIDCPGHRIEKSTFQNEVTGKWEVWERLADRPITRGEWYRVKGEEK